jgi:hypothetical protein
MTYDILTMVWYKGKAYLQEAIVAVLNFYLSLGLCIQSDFLPC